MLNNKIILITVLFFTFVLLSPGLMLTLPPYSYKSRGLKASVITSNENWWAASIFHGFVFIGILYVLFYKTPYFKTLIIEEGHCEKQNKPSVTRVPQNNTNVEVQSISVRTLE
tara:strand:- start:955 stop:1293 length:339 start_codon:yes stop_codon:yes gene_type:complete